MIIHSFDQVPSLFLEFVAELRNVDIQQDRMRFRKNLERIGELLSVQPIVDPQVCLRRNDDGTLVISDRAMADVFETYTRREMVFGSR